MRPGLRKAALTAHVACSVGWMGAVLAFIALAVAGHAGGDRQRVEAAYLGADLITRFVIVPLAAGTLATGLIQALSTRWGLFRHYWVVAKLLLTLLASAVLLLHTRPIGSLAEAATAHGATSPTLGPLRLEVILFSTAGFTVLMVIAALAVYKPRGLTRRGWRHQQRALRRRSAA